MTAWTAAPFDPHASLKEQMQRRQEVKYLMAGHAHWQGLKVSTPRSFLLDGASLVQCACLKLTVLPAVAPCVVHAHSCGNGRRQPAVAGFSGSAALAAESRAVNDAGYRYLRPRELSRARHLPAPLPRDWVRVSLHDHD